MPWPLLGAPAFWHAWTAWRRVCAHQLRLKCKHTVQVQGLRAIHALVHASPQTVKPTYNPSQLDGAPMMPLGPALRMQLLGAWFCQRLPVTRWLVAKRDGWGFQGSIYRSDCKSAVAPSR